MPRSTSFRYNQIVPLGNSDVHRVLPVRIACISLGQERMTGDRPGHRLVHERVQKPEHHRVTHIRPEQRRIRVTMDGAIENLRGFRVRRQPLRDWSSPEVQAAAGGVCAPVQERHRRHVDLFRHHKRHRLARFERHFDRLPGRVARGHDVDGVRYRVMHLHHQLAEAVVHSMADRLGRADVCNRAAPNAWSCQNTVPTSASTQNRCRTNSTVTMSFAGWSFFNPLDRVMLLPLMSLIRTISFPFTLSAPMRISVPTWYWPAFLTVIALAPFFAAAVSTVFIGSGKPFLFFFSNIVNGRT